MNYMKCASRLNVLQEDVRMKICVSSLESIQRSWLAHLCNPKSIPSSTMFIESFLRHYQPATQILQDALEELKHALCREGFPVDDETIDEEVLEGHIYEESYQEDSDEFSHVDDLDKTFDEDEVLISSLPLDENIQSFAPPLHQEENMMSCDPFE